MATLDILIPHYKETAEDIKPLLDSIAIQQSVDFTDIGVIIADDGPDAVDLPIEKWNKEYPFSLTHIKGDEHVGVSATRNRCLDASRAEYVMFCDADDMFCHACGLQMVLNEADMSAFDSLLSSFLEESRNPKDRNEVNYIVREMDSTFVHGKVHRRKYLVKNNIRFNDRLTVHEDSYFNILCQNLTAPERVKVCPMPFYLWKWRDSSVCRHDPDYILKTYNNMLDSNDALVDEFERRFRTDKSRMFVGTMVYDAYYLMNKPDWIEQENQHYREATERRFARYMRKHKPQWDALTKEEKMMISNGVRQRSVMEGMEMENMTLKQWLDHVLLEVEPDMTEEEAKKREAEFQERKSGYDDNGCDSTMRRVSKASPHKKKND